MGLQHQKEQVRSVTKNIILCPVFFLNSNLVTIQIQLGSQVQTLTLGRHKGPQLKLLQIEKEGRVLGEKGREECFVCPAGPCPQRECRAGV